MKALDVAKYIVNKCIELEKPISNIRLQKIMYFAHVGFLRDTHKKLIDDESFKAWQYGPVIKSVYNKFRIYGGFTIDDKQECDIALKPEESELIDNIVQKCINLKPWELVQKSHNPNGAWIKVYKDGEDYKDNVIPDELIGEEAFGNEIKQNDIDNKIHVDEVYSRLNDIRCLISKEYRDAFTRDIKVKIQFVLDEEKETTKGLIKFLDNIIIKINTLPYISVCDFDKWVVIKKKGTLTLKVKLSLETKNYRTYKKTFTIFMQE